jgi:predicted metal-dependent hydrolase
MSPPNAEREAVFQRGLEAYREGDHYEAHELWEELWENEEADDHRLFLQALIQVASAVHKLKNNVGPRGSLRLLESALAKIEGLPDVYGGVALGRFREGVERARREWESLVAEGRSDLRPSLIPPVDPVE